MLGTVVAAAVIGLIVLVSGGDDDEDAGSNTSTAQPNEPETVVRGFVQALNEGDCETLEGLTTTDFKEDDFGSSADEFLEDCRDSVEDDTTTARVADIRVTSQTDDWVELEATLTFNGSDELGRFELVKVDAEWRVDSVELDSLDDGDHYDY